MKQISLCVRHNFPLLELYMLLVILAHYYAKTEVYKTANYKYLIYLEASAWGEHQQDSILSLRVAIVLAGKVDELHCDKCVES